MGNMMQNTIFEIWKGKTLSNFRKNLLNGKRCNKPCSDCNADGTLLGKKITPKVGKKIIKLFKTEFVLFYNFIANQFFLNKKNLSWIKILPKAIKSNLYFLKALFIV